MNQENSQIDSQTATKTAEVFNELLDKIHTRADSIFAGLLIFEWIFAIFCAWIISPRTWEGDVSTLHIHVYGAVILGAVIISLPLILIAIRPGGEFTRHVIALSQMIMAALLIHLTGGRIETHFHIFGSLAFLAFYRDWKVLITATLFVALDHLLRGIYWPQSVYGTAVTYPWRWLEHTGWVLFEDAFLIYSCLKGRKELWEISSRQTVLESTNTAVEEEILKRTNELRRTQNELLQSQKLEAIGKLASGIAHDFNNLLGGILGYAGMLRQDLKHDPKLSECVAMIELCSERGSSLTQKLMAFARKGPYEEKSVVIRDCLKEVLAILSPTIDKSIAIEIKIDPKTDRILGDSNQIFQAIMNLAVNARDAMPEGGTLIFEVCNMDIDAEYCKAHKGFKPGRYVRVSVSDTGQGIPLEIQEKIFEPFFTTKEVGKGTGLGLAMVYGVMQSHKGQVTLYSEVGKGTIFHLYFLAYPSSSSSSNETMGTRSESQSDPFNNVTEEQLKGRRILVADDEEIIRKTAREILERQGATVQVAKDGEDAVQLLKADPDGFDTIILDIAMPKMDGFVAYEEMLKLRPDLIYLLASGYTESAQITELKKTKRVTFIQKPFRGEKLVQTLRDLKPS